MKNRIVLIENVPLHIADKCIPGVFNCVGGIEARKILIQCDDTNYVYNIITYDKMNKAKEERAKLFCEGIRYALR